MYLVKEVCFVEEGDRALDGVENFFLGEIYTRRLKRQLCRRWMRVSRRKSDMIH